MRLVIIDSIAALARADLGAASVADRQAALNAQAARLKYLAETFRMPVLVTNQVGAWQYASGKGTRSGSGCSTCKGLSGWHL